ncbi:MAG TPA: polysaccharide deacetylase family protein, partial [Phnomibacter sp.]|nr:polysaccharide deacetylase family protein [Phnomibacter sp.]
MFLLKTPLPFLIVLSAILLMGCTGSPVADEQPTGPITDSLNNLSKNKFNPSRTIYLTFDDGPMVGTETVITILEAQQVPATFFMVGKHAQFMPNAKSCLGRIKSNTAFEIANHSYSHGYNNHYDRYYNMPQAVVEDFEKAKPYLDPVLPLYRTPG